MWSETINATSTLVSRRSVIERPHVVAGHNAPDAGEGQSRPARPANRDRPRLTHPAPDQHGDGLGKGHSLVAGDAAGGGVNILGQVDGGSHQDALCIKMQTMR